MKRVPFNQLEVGEEFFDPIAGEFFEKISRNEARCRSGGDALEGQLDTFFDDEMVIQ